MPYAFHTSSVTPEERQQARSSVLPDGWYTARISAVEDKPTKAGGRGLNFKWQIDGPTHFGRVVFWWVTTQHEKPDVVTIGRSQLCALCEALGIEGFRDERELVGRVCDIKLGFQKGQNGYEDSNKLLACRAAPSVTVSAGPPTPRASAAQSLPARQPAPAQPSTNPYQDDDLPF